MKPGGGQPFPKPVKAGNRDGIGWYRDDMDRWSMSSVGITAQIIGDPASDSSNSRTRKDEAGLMTLERTLQDALTETDEAFQQFDKARTKFRQEIKNEVSSIEAAAKKIAGEFERVVVALSKLQTTYTSGGFVDAVKNAERLAAALKSIQEINNSKMTIAVIEHTPDHG